MVLFSDVPIFQPPLLVELGHTIVTAAAVELQAIRRAVVFGEVGRALLPGVASLAVLPELLRSRCLWPWF